MVYVSTVTPSCAVTRTTTMLAPTVSARALLGAPLPTGVQAPPLTCTSRLASALDAVGVTVTVGAANGTATT